MSKGLGWTIKLVSWFAIYFIASMCSDGNMSFGTYVLVIFLCALSNGVVGHFVKPDEESSEVEILHQDEMEKDE